MLYAVLANAEKIEPSFISAACLIGGSAFIVALAFGLSAGMKTWNNTKHFNEPLDM